MLYQNVCLEAFAYTLPDEIVTSAEIESRLEPLYRRLRLPEGRLELMTGICPAAVLAARHDAQPSRASRRPKRPFALRESTSSRSGP